MDFPSWKLGSFQLVARLFPTNACDEGGARVVFVCVTEKAREQRPGDSPSILGWVEIKEKKPEEICRTNKK